MAKAKRTLLPKDFDTLLEAGDIDAIKAVFQTCDVNARGGYRKQTALAFNDLPDDLVHWLVEQGADIDAPDSQGATPLHTRAGHWQGRIETLLALGADVEAKDQYGDTPLHRAVAVGNRHTTELLLKADASANAHNARGQTPLAKALEECSNAKLVELTEAVGVLVMYDAYITQEMRESVKRLGDTFAFHRDGYNPDTVDAAAEALELLYALAGLGDLPTRTLHDGVSRITATTDNWQEQHQAWWALLVPSRGAAFTVQGEVIRISGRLASELDDNGGANWDKHFRNMADALLQHLRSGVPLPPPEQKEAMQCIREIKQQHGDPQRLMALAVAWVRLNPKPVALEAPHYRR